MLSSSLVLLAVAAGTNCDSWEAQPVRDREHRACMVLTTR